LIFITLLTKCNCISFINTKKALVSIYLLASSFIFCQECNLKIKGYIIDSNSNSVLKGAVIQVVGKKVSTISNDDGTFMLENLCLTDNKLKISHINCNQLIRKIDFFQSSNVIIIMDHKVEALDEVIIAERKIKSSSTAKIYSLSEIEKDRYSNSGLSGAISQISGVTTLSTGGNISQPVIHGMFGSRVGIIYDGILLENQQWGQDHAPNVDINAFENIRLIKGAGALRYSGSSPGGVIILESSLPKKIDSLYGKTLINGVSNGLGGSLISSWTKSYENGKYLKAQGTYKISGDLNTPQYILSNTGNNEKNLSLSFGSNNDSKNWKLYFSYFNTEIGILKSSHIGNVGDLLIAIENKDPGVIDPFTYDINYPKQSNTHYTTSIDFSKYYDLNNKLSFKYSWQKNNRKEFDVRIGSVKNTAALNLNLDTHNLNTSYEWKNSFAGFSSGLFFQIQNNYSTPGTAVKRLIPDYLKTKFGSYVTGKIDNNNINFGFGLRYEYNSNDVHKYYRNTRWEAENYEEILGPYVVDEILSQKLIKKVFVFNTLSINTGVLFKLSENKDLNIQYNYIERAPDIAEMFSDGLHHALASFEYGNPFLKKEKTHKIIINLEKKSGVFKYNLSPFITSGKNYIIIEPSGFEQTIRGAFPVWEYSPYNVFFKGIDLDFSYNFNDYIKFKHNSSYVQGINDDNNEALVGIPPLILNNQLSFYFSNWKKVFVSLFSKNVFQQKLFPNNNTVTSVFENSERVDKIVDVSTPPNGYHDLGVNFSFGPYKMRSLKMNVSLVIDNVLNNKYRNYLNRLRFYSDELGRNIMLQIKIQH